MGSLHPSKSPTTLTRAVDQVAATRPGTRWVSVPKSNDPKDGYQDISFHQLSQAVNRMSRWIERMIGSSSANDTLAFMGVNDIRYIITLLAAMKTGYQTLLPSPRNSVEAQIALLGSTRCKWFLHSCEMAVPVKVMQGQINHLLSFEIPTLDELLNADADSARYVGIADDDPYKVVIVIHTSGSTGVPKPIFIRNGTLSTLLNFTGVETPNGRPTIVEILLDRRPMFCPLPWFHAMAIATLARSIFCEAPLVLAPPGRLVNADMALEIIRAAKPALGFLGPSLLEDLVDIPHGLEAIASMKDIIFAGAPLSWEVGNKIAQLPGLRFQTLFGSSEAFVIDSYRVQDPADWEYLEWTSHSGASMRPVGDGLFELVIQRLDNELQATAYCFPELDEYHTKDLFEKHSTKPGLWRSRGRNDDVIVLSNGEKFGPVDFEKAVEGHPSVMGAVVVGSGHFQAGLLVEMRSSAIKPEQDTSACLEMIWPTVEKANQNLPTHAQIWKSKIAIFGSDKPFERAAKGSIMRSKTNVLYEAEINALYSHKTFGNQLGRLQPGTAISEIKDVVRQAALLTLKMSNDFKDEADIFLLGVDSLQVMALASALNHAMPQTTQESRDPVNARFVYQHPTLTKLVSALYAELNKDDFESVAAPSRETCMSELIHKYTNNLSPTARPTMKLEKHNVILTGSTGSLGHYLLKLLTMHPNVNKIYCINRSQVKGERNDPKDVQIHVSRVEFLHGRFGQERFGLEEKIYKHLQDTVSVFIHNAWAVDFNMNLESFEEVHIAGVRRCIDFSASSKYRPQITFVSSIASVGNWLGAGRTGSVPEGFLEDNTLPLPQGYAESKHVASCILAAAAKHGNIPVSILRVGQIAGPDESPGSWKKNEWLPTLIASSKAIGKIPRTLGNLDVVDWIPINTAARIILDLTFTRAANLDVGELETYHVINPHTVTWMELVPAIQDFYATSGVMLEAVEYEIWLETMQQISLTPEEVARVPGLKLLDFYKGLATKQGLPRLATTHTAQASATMREMKPVDKVTMAKWLQQWNF